MYGQLNGWREARLRTDAIPCTDFITGLTWCQSPFCDREQRPEAAVFDMVIFGTSGRLELWDVGNSERGPVPVCGCDLEEQDMIYCIENMGSGRFATGDSQGFVRIWAADQDQQPPVWPLSASRLPLIQSPVVDMQYCQSSGRIYALQDATFSMTAPVGARNVVRCWDAGSQHDVGVAHEVLEEYELVAFTPASDNGDLGNELVAGAVHGGFCAACYSLGIPSLCWHKSAAHTAIICVFDIRVGLQMVQRYSTAHRSMYPAMRCARDHFIFTSHSGQPLCVWDKRYMSTTVYEEEYLANFPMPAGEGGADLMPFGCPARTGEHQGLFLDTDGDLLVGRAENGMTWLWDLSTTLGWAQGGGLTGSWLDRALNDYIEAWREYRDWPIPLGACPCDTSIPTTLLRGGQPYALVGLETKETQDEVMLPAEGMDPTGNLEADHQESIFCARLRPPPERR
ncbi:hypothetical protein WJX72_003975 [[Myrmecia] bisecta]|uniref:Uncharacterized protein n=1 Tax=[Myrmecia] bisecta TaxID=41462 RepID=A0AAW1QQQ0_9CHLO